LDTQEISRVNDLAYDPISPMVVYAAAGNDEWGGLYKSTDSGVTWESIGEGQMNGAPLDIAVEPGTHRVFVTINGGLPLYVSADGGATWTPTASGGGHNVNEILFVPSVIPGNPPVLYDAAMQGLYRSTDGAQSWQQAAGELGQVPVYSLAAVTATDRVILYAGTTGGYIESGGAQELSLTNNDSTLVNAGVYRYTTRRTWQMYLPRVLRAYIP
jgi:hypothetical protein